MRHTETPEEGNSFLQLGTTQAKLDAFWELIENHYEEEWRVEFSGSVVLVVDDAMLERVLQENYSVAWYTFGSYAAGMKEGPKFERFMVQRPEWLKGLWSIQGIYAPTTMAYVGGPRTYHFEPEA